MNKNLLLIAFILEVVLCYDIQAQGNSVLQLSLFGAYGRSDFKLENHTQASNIPIGGQLNYGGILKIGIEHTSNVAYPYTFNLIEPNSNEQILKEKIYQNETCAFVMLDLSHNTMMGPYVRAGGALFTGKHHLDYSDKFKAGSGLSNLDSDMSKAFGYNLGGGFNAKLGYDEYASAIFFTEFIYHIVERTMDKASFSANNWQVRTGIRLQL